MKLSRKVVAASWAIPSRVTGLQAKLPRPPAGCSGGRALGQGPQVVALAEADAVVTEDRVGVGVVEKEVGQRVLEEIVVAGHRLALPTGLRHRAGGGAFEVLFGIPVEVVDHRADARA